MSFSGSSDDGGAGEGGGCEEAQLFTVGDKQAGF
uniref:Uncharacterized protein n=1 Tax=Rhizophora mucronata TaxID=61149 RepID=A0A2P2QCR4_RHIMU